MNLFQWKPQMLQGKRSNVCLACTEIEKQFKNQIWASYIVDQVYEVWNICKIKITHIKCPGFYMGVRNMVSMIQRGCNWGNGKKKSSEKSEKWICNYILHGSSLWYGDSICVLMNVLVSIVSNYCKIKQNKQTNKQ